MTDFLETTVEPLLTFLADWSLRWAVLIAILAVVLGLIRPRRAAVRYLLCLSVLVAGQGLPALPRWGGGFHFVQPAPPTGTEPEVVAVPVRPLHQDETPVSDDIPTTAAVVESTVSEQPETPVPVASAPLNYGNVLMATVAGAWAVGVALLLCRRLVGAWFLHRLRRTASAVGGPPLALLAACRADLGLRRTVALATHPLVHSPVAFGLFRPIIVVPEEWSGLPETVQRATLLHELAHLARGDDRLNVLLELVRVMFFFHPAVRWLLARLERERELLCDETALAHGVDRRDYVRMLLDFARQPCRLGFPGALSPLRFGNGRTVKARISHLLEEDMNRAMQPLTTRRAWAFGSLVLVCALGVGSFRVVAIEAAAAQDPRPEPAAAKPAEQPPVPKIKREELRYGGKDFDQWRAELQIELKPEIRIDGLKALATFGINGYGPEATAAILETEKSYDIVAHFPDDTKVYNAGLEAIARIGAPAVPVLRDGLANDNQNIRRFAAAGLKKIGPPAKPAWAALVKALEDKDAQVRQQAVEALPEIDPAAEELPGLLARALNKDEKSYWVRVMAINGLRGMGPKARKAVPALVEVLREKDVRTEVPVLTALQRIKPDLKEIIGPVMEAFEEKEWTSVPQEAINLLTVYGKDGGPAVGPLVALLQTKEAIRYQRAIIDLLGGMGPTAKEALPQLAEIIRTSTDSNSIAAARAAYKAIEEK